MATKQASKPYAFTIPKHGYSSIGYLSSVENSTCFPFVIKRVFWTYKTPSGIIRGKHAHRKTEQVLIAVAGIIKVTTTFPNGETNTFTLDTPYKAVYIPPSTWITMQYSKNALQLVFASTVYDEKDYVRDYSEFAV